MVTEIPRSESDRSRRWLSLAHAFSLVVALVGAAVLVGWALHIPALKSVSPGLVSMKANTAIGMLLCGAALALLTRKRVEKPIRYLAAAAALAAMVLGSLTLAEYLVGWDLRIDQWLFSDLPGTIGTSQPGRMSTASSLCFVLAGAALLLAAQQTLSRVRQPIVAGLAASLIVFGVLALLGYVLETGVGYHLWNYTGTAIHTATGFVLLGCGLLALVCSESGLTWSLDRLTTATFVVLIVLMIVVAGSAYNLAKQLQETATWVSHTREVLKEVQDVATDIAAAESAQRDFIIAGDERSRAQFTQAIARLPGNLGDVRKLTADNPNQQRRLDQLDPLVAQRVAFADRTIGLRNQEGVVAAQQLIANGAGTALADRIASVLQEMQEEEHVLLNQRQKRSESASVTTFLLLPLGLFLSLTTLFLGVFLLNAGVTDRSQAEGAASVSQARLAGIVNSAMDAIISVNREQRIVLFNAAAERMFGWSEAEALGQPIDTFIPQRFREQHQQHVDGFSETGVTSQSMRSLGELSGLRAQGEEFPIEASISQIEVAGQKIFTVVPRDITERQKAEAAGVLLAAVVESSFDAIIGKDLHSLVTSWNAGAERMFGYRADEMIGSSIVQLIPPDLQDDEERILAQIRRGETVEHFETVRVRKDGRLIDVSVTVSPIKQANGEIIGASKVARDITERKRAEVALRESEDQFRTMANSIPQLAWMAHADGFIFWYNQRWHDYTGTTPEQMEGGGWQGVHDPEVLPKVLEKWRGAIANRQPFEMEFPLRGADGRFRIFLTRVQPLKDSRGVVVQWFGTNTDVDELKRMEESLLDTQARLNSTLAAGSIGTWTWDIVNDRLCADEFTARMFSIDADAAAKGLPVAAYFQGLHEEDRPGVADALARAIESCGPYDIEYRVRQKDGEFRWLQARGRVEGDAAGNALNFHGAVMDITARKRAEEEIHRLNTELEQRVIERTAQLEATNCELRQSRAELNSLFESLPGPCLVLTPDLEIVSASDAYLKATLTTRAGILGRNLFEVFPDNPNDPGTTAVANMRVSIDRVIKNAVSDTMAIQKHDVRRPDGVFEERYWSPINSPVLGADRELKYIVHRVEDVTEFMRQKSQPSGGTIELTAQVQQMEAEIFRSSQDLQLVNQQLGAANKELESFSYSVSHDLRAPLRHINGFSQALLEDYADKLDDTGKGYLQEVRGATREMAQLIDDVLQLARVTRSEMHREVVNLSELAQAIVAELQSADAEHTAVVQIEEGLEAQGDKRLLRVMLVNLIGNAWKFTSKKERPEIGFGHEERDGETVYFVRDNGAGFDMKFGNKLFGAFQRLHTTAEFEGTGIGLATVQRIVNRHGGRVWAAGNVNQGATFYFTLPHYKGERT